MSKFNPHSAHPERAVQAWQILVGKAMNRQTVTYQGLSRLMYRKDAGGVLGAILGHIAFYCEDNDLYQISIRRTHSGARYRALPFEPAGPCRGADIYRFLSSGHGISRIDVSP